MIWHRANVNKIKIKFFLKNFDDKFIMHINKSFHLLNNLSILLHNLYMV
jgi:hypothetical protein